MMRFFAKNARPRFTSNILLSTINLAQSLQSSNLQKSRFFITYAYYDKLNELKNNIREDLHATTYASPQKYGDYAAVGRLTSLEHYERIIRQCNEMIHISKNIPDKPKAAQFCKSTAEFLLLNEPHHSYMNIRDKYSIALSIEKLFFSLGNNRFDLRKLADDYASQGQKDSCICAIFLYNRILNKCTITASTISDGEFPLDDLLQINFSLAIQHIVADKHNIRSNIDYGGRGLFAAQNILLFTSYKISPYEDIFKRAYSFLDHNNPDFGNCEHLPRINGKNPTDDRLIRGLEYFKKELISKITERLAEKTCLRR